MASKARAGSGDDGAAFVDVVIPVYNAVDDVVRCVDSVLLHTDHPYRLVLIDDASPDPRIGAYFAELKRRALPQVVLLRNRRNLGFPGTANRGMLHSRADVVLLNSDTLVTAGWLDALARCAASCPDIGTITPFSNNAEICSFPRFCEVNDPDGGDAAETVRTALARAAVPSYPCLPTGVGFCLYIRRELIDAIGTFDTAFGPGYGEENDFCMRALASGYKSVLCDDAYVLHLGGRSFGGQKAELGVRNTALLVARHPHYVDMVREFIACDPLRPLRNAALTQQRILSGPARGVLHVLQSHGGGTERQVHALIAASRTRYRHYVAIAVGDEWRIEEFRDDGTVSGFEFRRLPAESWPDFLAGLAATFGIDLVHLHSISRCREGLVTALEDLDLPYGYTVHDLNFACPTITFLAADGMYCGSVTDDEVCARCLAAQPALQGVNIVEWRALHRRFLAGSAFLIAPSQWAADTLARYFPDRPVAVIPHGAPADAAAPTNERTSAAMFDLPDDGIPTIAVMGAVGPDKGARRLERIVDSARRRVAHVRFVLIGYLDVQHGPWQSDDAMLTIHGHYDPRDLAQLFDHYRIRLVAYPSAGPETFSLTLSETWGLGRPVIVPPFGALGERVRSTGAGWLWTDAEWRSEDAMLERILELVAPVNGAALEAAATRAETTPQQTIAAMTEETLARYDACCGGRARGHVAPFAAARVRDALGYAPWFAPSVPPPRDANATPSGLSGRLSRAAHGFRQSTAGRALSRLMPSAARAAKKRRTS